MTDKLKLAAGALIMWLAVCPVEAKVCFLPSEGCGLKNPNDEPGPTPECTGDWKKGDCSGFRDKTLYSCETMGNCYKYSCLYKSFESCAEASSTKYCEQDSSSGCYKSATNPNPNPNPADDCEGYDDEYNESCACTQCPSDSSRYSCNCTEEMSCKKYGESLGKVYDTLSDLSCSNSQVYEPTGDTKKGEACYYCRNKTCKDYGEFEKGKGNCGANEKEEQDTSTGCYKCVEKPAESDDICFKFNYTCNGKTCRGTDFNKFMDLVNDDGLFFQTFWDNTGLTPNNGEYCLSKKTIMQEFKIDISNGDGPEDISLFRFDLDYAKAAKTDDYYKNLKEVNRYKFNNGRSDSSFERAISMFVYKNEFYYSYGDGYDGDSGYDIYGNCDEEIYYSGISDDVYYEKMVSCMIDKGFAKVSSSPIALNIDLLKLIGEDKCIYFTATCPDLEKNGGNAGYCIDRVSAYVADSGDESRIGTVSLDYTKSKYERDSSNVTFDFADIAQVEGDKVKISVCGYGASHLQDWDVVHLTVTPNLSTDSYGKGAYIYNDKTACEVCLEKNNNSKCTYTQDYKNKDYGNLCTNNVYVYNVGDTSKSATMVPFIKYNFSSLKGCETSGSKINCYCGISLSTNRKLTKSVWGSYDGELHVSCLVNNYEGHSWVSGSMDYSSTDGRCFYNPTSHTYNCDFEEKKSYFSEKGYYTGRGCSDNSSCSVGTTLTSGYNYEDGYYYIVTGVK